MKPWKRFWFESNRFFDWVNGPEDWKRLMNEYPDKTEEWILKSKASDGALAGLWVTSRASRAGDAEGLL